MVSSTPLPKQRKEKKPIPEPTKRDCRKYIILLDKLSKALIVSVDRLSKEYENARVDWPDPISYNFTRRADMHRMADNDIYEIINGKEMGVALIDLLWVSGDNISEENACKILRKMNNISWQDVQYFDIPTKSYSTIENMFGEEEGGLISNFQLSLGTMKKIRATPFMKGVQQLIDSYIVEFDIIRKRGYQEAMKKWGFFIVNFQYLLEKN